MNQTTPDKNVMNLANSIGDFIQYWGFKSIEGKIWAYIFLNKDPVCASDLVEKFQVSKTLVSFAIKRLIDYDVLIESGRGEQGKVYLSANRDIFEVITGVLRKRELKLLDHVLTQLKEIDHTDGSLSSTRLKYLHKFVKNAHILLKGLITAKDISLNKFFIGKAPS